MKKLKHIAVTVVFVVLVIFLVWKSTWNDFLIWAVDDGDESIVAALLATGAKADATYIARETALSLAARQSDPSMAKLLIAHGAQVNLPDRYGFTPLMEAARKGNLEMVRTLLAAGADPTMFDNAQAKTALDIVPADRPEVAKVLKDAVAPKPKAEAAP